VAAHGPATKPDVNRRGLVVEGPVALDRLGNQLAERMLTYRRYRQKVEFTSGGRYWVDDPHFDIAHHIKRMRLPGRGGKEALKRFRRRSRLRAAQFQLSALDGAHHRRLRGRRGRGVPLASCDSRRHWRWSA
jgi:hypothetical protein